MAKPQLKTAIQACQFTLTEGNAAQKENIPAGLFLLWAPADPDPAVTQPADLSQVQLAFIGKDGIAYDFTGSTNPWFLVTDKSPKLATVVAVPFGPQPYFFCFVAHPSPVVAATLLANARQAKPITAGGPPFVWTRLTAVAKPKLLFTIPSAGPFIPQGPARYGGVHLYRRHPLSGLSTIKTAISSLASDLGTLRYMTGTRNATDPYSSDLGAVELTLQAAIHHFQEDLAAGTAFKTAAPSDASATWGLLFGAAQTTTAVTVTDPGVVDNATAAAIVDWISKGQRKPGPILVQDRSLWALPALWFRMWAVEELTLALGGMYKLTNPGSSLRYLVGKSAGQSLQSKHKVGMAFDLNAIPPDPPTANPYGMEADWEKVNKGKGFKPKWIVHMHSRLAPDAPLAAGALANVVPNLRARMTKELGATLNQEATDYLTLVQGVVDTLTDLATKPGSPSAFHDQFVRTTIRRFQFRDDAEGSDIGAPVKAQDDAVANGLTRGSDARSWINVSRLAFRLDLYTISAHDEFCRRADFKADDTVVPFTESPAVLDRIAEAAKQLPTGTVVQILGPKGFIGNTRSELIHIETLQNWLHRTTDSTGSPVRPPAGAKIGILDLTITVPPPGSGRNAILQYLKDREKVNVQIIDIGPNVTIDTAANPLFVKGKIVTGKVAMDALTSATLVPVPPPDPKAPKSKKPDTSFDVRLRPMFITGSPLTIDPGQASIQLPMGPDPRHLEWWHVELDYGGKDWAVQADSLGFSKAVIAAKESQPADSTGPIWQGGMGIDKPQLYGKPSEPKASPATPDLPPET